MANDQHLHVFTKGLKVGGIHKNTISDLIVDAVARKAAVTTAAELVFNNGEELKLDFSWFCTLTKMVIRFARLSSLWTVIRSRVSKEGRQS
jgi:hypothetical protein